MLDAYLSVFENHDAATLPLSEGASFSGPILPEPIVGRRNVVEFLNRVAPTLMLKEIKQKFETSEGACAELVFYFPSRELTLDEVHCLHYRDGTIDTVRLYFDPRPLFRSDESDG